MGILLEHDMSNYKDNVERFLEEELPGVEFVYDHFSMNRYLSKDNGDGTMRQIRISPELWTRLMSIDPGVQIQAAQDLFECVPKEWRRSHNERQIRPGLKFLNEHGDLCEFRRDKGNGLWEGTWLTAFGNIEPSLKYKPGGAWVESENFFWNQIDNGKKKLISDEEADKMMAVERLHNPPSEEEEMIVI